MRRKQSPPPPDPEPVVTTAADPNDICSVCGTCARHTQDYFECGETYRFQCSAQHDGKPDPSLRTRYHSLQALIFARTACPVRH